MDILIDFDGTCVTHDFPRVGKEIGAVPVLRALVRNGHRLILFTMRSNRAPSQKIDTETHEEIQDVHGNFLDDAVNWFKQNEIELYGIQTNPTQHKWTTSPKAYGQLMIDDAALGCPLTRVYQLSSRPFVDWLEVQKRLYDEGLLSDTSDYVPNRYDLEESAR